MDTLLRVIVLVTLAAVQNVVTEEKANTTSSMMAALNNTIIHTNTTLHKQGYLRTSNFSLSNNSRNEEHSPLDGAMNDTLMQDLGIGFDLRNGTMERKGSEDTGYTISDPNLDTLISNASKIQDTILKPDCNNTGPGNALCNNTIVESRSDVNDTDANNTFTSGSHKGENISTELYTPSAKTSPNGTVVDHVTDTLSPPVTTTIPLVQNNQGVTGTSTDAITNSTIASGTQMETTISRKEQERKGIKDKLEQKTSQKGDENQKPSKISKVPAAPAAPTVHNKTQRVHRHHYPADFGEHKISIEEPHYLHLGVLAQEAHKSGAWREKHYMMSVLIPIGAGIAGAMIIVMIAFAMKQCQFRIRRPVSRGDRDDEEAPSDHDRIMLLADSSDEDM